VLFIAVAVAVSIVDEPATDPTALTPVDFQLPTTSGEMAAFDADAPGRTLLFFSMGVGCDICFTQIPEIEFGLNQRGIRLLSIMVNPADMVAREAQRLGVNSPILIDEDRSVSAAYGMLGLFGHGDLPTHSFALIEDGEVAWVRHYPDVFVPAPEFFAELDSAALDS
jgi:peroxiredoxin Q/BCP